MAEMKPLFSWRHAVVNSELPSTTRHVLLTLSIYMNDAGGSCFPSVERLARETGLSQKAVIKHLKIARQGEWITSKTHGFSGQGWKRHEYQAAWPEGLSGPGPTQKGGEPGSLPFLFESEAPNHKAGNGGAEGGEPRAKGGEPEGKKVVNHVHSISSVNSQEIIQEHTLAPGGAGKGSETPRPRDLLWESMLTGCGISLTSKLTDSERGKFNRALKLLRAAEATPAEITRRCQMYRKKWPAVTLTPTALAGNWNLIVSANTGAKPKRLEGLPY